MDTALYLEKKFGPHKGNPHQIKNFSREDIYKLFAKLEFKVGAEIGVETGKNAFNMFEIIPNLKLFAIDPYKQHPKNSKEAERYLQIWNNDFLKRVKGRAQNRLQGKNVVFIEKFSEEATHDIVDSSLDFVYIDADHSYDAVMQDIIIWGKKVRREGIIAGHDYYYDNNTVGRLAKVTEAVNDYTQAHNIKFYITGEGRYTRKGDIPPSWFWVKLEEIYPNVVGR